MPRLELMKFAFASFGLVGHWQRSLSILSSLSSLVLILLISQGICHTDEYTRSGKDPEASHKHIHQGYDER